MTAPRKPQDHLDKVEKPKVTPVDGGRNVEYKGVSVTIQDVALDDFELLDDLRSLDVDSKLSSLPGVLRRLVGDEYPKVMNALRGADGRVTVSAGMGYIQDVFGALNPN